MQNYRMWAKNITSIAYTNTPGKCPMCGSDNTDYATRVIEKKTSLGYCVIWCNDCKKNARLDKMTIEINSAVDKVIPEDIEY